MNLTITHRHVVDVSDRLYSLAERFLDRRDSGITSLQRSMHTMAVNLDNLVADVQRNTTEDASAKALIVGLVAKIEDLGKNTADAAVQQKVDELVAQLKGSTDDLVAAVTANTPADPSAGNGSTTNPSDGSVQDPSSGDNTGGQPA